MNALPDRRPCETFRVDLLVGHRVVELYATLGYCPVTACITEIFLRYRGAEGSDTARLLDDLGELFSRMLRAGIDPVVLAYGFGRLGEVSPLPGERRSPPPRASMIGALADWLAGQALEDDQIITVKTEPTRWVGNT